MNRGMDDPGNDRMLGMSESDYNRSASAHCKAAIFTWLVSGRIYAGVTGQLLSWESLLLLFPGVFVASLISLLTFLASAAVKRPAAAMAPGAAFTEFVSLFIVTIVLIVLFLVPIVSAVVFVEGCRRVVARL